MVSHLHDGRGVTEHTKRVKFFRVKMSILSNYHGRIATYEVNEDILISYDVVA